MTAIETYLSSIGNTTRQADARTLLTLMQEASGYPPWLAGTMIGYGQYHYKYDSGREGDWFVTGFAPRKQNTVVYIMPGFSEYQALLDTLGKYKTGKSCLYINKLKDVDLDVLKKLVQLSVVEMQRRYECRVV